MPKINLFDAYEKASESRRQDAILRLVTLAKSRAEELSQLRAAILGNAHVILAIRDHLEAKYGKKIQDRIST